ncbi:MAG: histone deacetylase [Thermoanaerobaculia bacterium]
MEARGPDETPAFHDPVVLRHHTGVSHPETGERVARCVTTLRSAGVRIESPASPARTLAAIQRVHPAEYVTRFERAVSHAPDQAGGRAFSLFDSPDNPISATTFEAATRAVGLTLAAVDEVLADRARSVFVAVRPPGHHARAARAMGFCFFNTIAVAARDLLENGAISRVLVADFDVHHGNGTQELFWEDERVAYLSVHRYPFYPGTGAADELGSGPGRGTTLNVPVAEGAGDDVYVAGFEAALETLTAKFRPDFVLVSAGFDAHERDPLGGMRVSTTGFSRLTRALAEVAQRHAKGRIVSLLEGGYDPAALGESALAHVQSLQVPR